MHAYQNSEYKRAGTAMIRALRLLSILWADIVKSYFAYRIFELFLGSAKITPCSY